MKKVREKINFSHFLIFFLKKITNLSANQNSLKWYNRQEVFDFLRTKMWHINIQNRAFGIRIRINLLQMLDPDPYIMNTETVRNQNELMTKKNYYANKKRIV